MEQILPPVMADLKRFHRKLEGKHLRDFFRIVIEHRESLREEWDGFIRFNNQKKELEWYVPERDK